MSSEDTAQYPHADLTRQIIGAAYEVHKHLGHGFLERVYGKALLHELATLGLSAIGEAAMEVKYKGLSVGLYYADILVEQSVICEIKAATRLMPEHEAQLLNYLKATGIRVGLLLNFGTRSVQVKRLIL